MIDLKFEIPKNFWGWARGVISTFPWGAKFFLFFNATGLLKNWKKQHFICSNLTLFIVPFFLFSLFSLFFSLFSFFLSFFLFPWGRPPPSLLKWRPWDGFTEPLHRPLPRSFSDLALDSGFARFRPPTFDAWLSHYHAWGRDLQMLMSSIRWMNAQKLSIFKLRILQNKSPTTKINIYFRNFSRGDGRYNNAPYLHA